ncbi:MAG: MFS transporter [Polyangiaceae bacterium]|nr:MFS transporter [Polyangiaceae bacterium]
MEHGSYALVIFTLPMLASAILEAAISLRSDRWPRRAAIAGALAVLGAALAASALATTPWLLALGLGVAGAASGVACGAAQGELIAVHKSADRALARWTVFAWGGDLLGPAVVSATMYAGHSYRWVLGLAAVVLAFQAVFVWRVSDPRDAIATEAGSEEENAAEAADDDPEEAHEPLRAVLSRGAVTVPLLVWLFGASLCHLLDEIAAALAALRIERDLGATEALAGASLTAFSLGGFVASLFLERAIDRFRWRAVLAASAIASIAAVFLFIAAPTPAWSWPALVLLGISVAPHYGIAKARAYEAVPGRPGLVNAAAQLFVVLELATPAGIGVLADRYGLGLAFGCLILQPLGLLALAAFYGDKSGKPPT